MVKNTVIAVAAAAAFAAPAFAGNTSVPVSEPTIVVPDVIEPTGSLASSSGGAALPIIIGGVLIAAIAAGGGS